jgi:DNA-binding MurR/RpiR family transcriptional regulator
LLRFLIQRIVTAVSFWDKIETTVPETALADRLALRIQDCFENLSPSEKKLATFLVETQEDILTYSATELAGLAGVSKATAARLFRSLGYQGFNEVRLQAREERNQTAPMLRVPAPAPRSKRAGLISAHLQSELGNLTRTFEELGSDHLRKAAKLLAAAPKVWVLATGPEDGIARHLRLLLARIRPAVHLLQGDAGQWAEDMAMMGPKDALILFAFRPLPQLMPAILDWASTSRSKLVAITDPTTRDRLRRYGATTLVCHVVGPTFGPSQTAAISLTRLIAAATADQIGSSASKRLQLIATLQDEMG